MHIFFIIPGSSNLICCPEFRYALPTRKPQFAGQTTSSPSPSPSNNTDSSGDKSLNRNQACGANNYQDLKVRGNYLSQRRDCNPRNMLKELCLFVY